MITIDTLYSDFRSRFDADVTRRIGRMGKVLEQEFKKAVARATLVSSGASGSLGGIVSDVKAAENSVRLQLGLSPQGDKLKYRLFGVKPAPGAFYPKATKPYLGPEIRQWVKKAPIGIPETAWFGVAVNIMKKGKTPLKSDGAPLLETVLLLQQGKLRAILEGSES